MIDVSPNPWKTGSLVDLDCPFVFQSFYKGSTNVKILDPPLLVDEVIKSIHTLVQ